MEAIVNVVCVRFLLSRRWILFFVAVVMLAYLAFRLGEWQFDRLEEREQRNAVTQRNLAADPVPVEDVLGVDQPVSAQDEWRHVTATGDYADDETVVVRYQTRDGKSGVDAVTPLVTDQGWALLVNRGWVATGNVGTTEPDIPPAPPGEVTITGNRAEFLGRYGSVDDPAALRLAGKLSGTVGVGLDPCAAIQRSCFGVLSPTQMTSGRAALIISTTAASSSAVS